MNATTDATLTTISLSETIQSAYAGFIEREQRKERSQKSRDYVYASAWRACTRQMALELLYPERIPDFSIDTLANLRRGKDRERDLLTDLTRSGRQATPPFEVIGQEQRFELLDRKGHVVIVGKVDAQIKCNGNRYPLEVKSWNPNLVARIERFQDLFSNRWTRSGAHQILAYLYGMSQPSGFLLLDGNGLPKLLEVRLEDHLERMEDFLARAEFAASARPETLPPYHADTVECKYCPFYGSTCNPPSHTEGAQLIVDETIVQKVERYLELREAGEEYETLDEEIKKHFRGIDMAIAGKALIEGKWIRDTRYDLPADVKDQIEKIKANYRKTVEKGKFVLKVTKI